ncbi:hypothetical protein E4T56_gene13346 [Termitomyces sp. T112]|nr:hypothetical protein E4T56_gene13346 [Termitomyces sp. T112]
MIEENTGTEPNERDPIRRHYACLYSKRRHLQMALCFITFYFILYDASEDQPKPDLSQTSPSVLEDILVKIASSQTPRYSSRFISCTRSAVVPKSYGKLK